MAPGLPGRAAQRSTATTVPIRPRTAAATSASFNPLASGLTVGRVTRRLAALRRAGILYFDIDLATELMGFSASAYLWLVVEPASLAAVGEQIGRHPEVP